MLEGYFHKKKTYLNGTFCNQVYLDKYKDEINQVC